jgi:hypothetical protein
MNVLVGCEHSGIIREAFKSRGHTVYSCDLLPSVIPSEFHIQDDILKVIKNPPIKFDLFIAHPPCTYLSVAGSGHRTRARDKKTEEAIEFFKKLYYSTQFRHICMENPVGFINKFVPHHQIVHPFYFAKPGSGENVMKQTCLWLRNLPLLKYETNPRPAPRGIFKSGAKKGQSYNWCDGVFGPKRAMVRSKTFHGIANAMAEQWSNALEWNATDVWGKAI